MTTVLVLPAASLYRSDDNEELRNEYHLYHMHHVGGNPEDDMDCSVRFDLLSDVIKAMATV